MPLGERLPAWNRDWRVVEGDLHDIARRVQEYDSRARLVRQDGTGHLGIAVEQKYGIFKALQFVRTFHDLRTDLPLSGVPDARVLHCQKAYDGRRFSKAQWIKWNHRLQENENRLEAKGDAAASEINGDIAEQFVHNWKGQTTHRPRAFIGKGLDRKAAA